MPTFADELFKALRGVQGIKPGQLASLRSRAAQLEEMAGQWSDAVGSLRSDVFLRKQDPFILLPHETARMTDGGTQSISTATWTISTYTAGSTWSHGFKYDLDTGKVTVFGPAQNAVFLIAGFVTFEPHATGNRKVMVLTNAETQAAGGGIPIATIPAINGTEDTVVPYFYMVRPTSTPRSFAISVYQDSGGDLDISNRIMGIIRVR